MEPKITTFIFDCFGVICEPVLNGWYRDNRLKKGLVDENLKSVFEKFDLGELSEDDIVDYFLKYDGVNLTKEEMREQIDAYLGIDGELVKVIKSLKSKGFKTALLSNANASFFERKIYPTYPEFKDLFDELIISSEIGMVKPYKDIYEYTLKKINSKPEESLFIDDSKTNVDTAIDLGIQGFVYTNKDFFTDYLKSIGINLN
ncbi:MAG: HAD family phosphatase [Candidatus Pacebacteria bacterium]|nr:HAD family phosphatase [Candidatus Paceibacterota bacterium]MBP9772799.1 HAD family phosphatase [Candidatus Paceibacterota bacterium]